MRVNKKILAELHGVYAVSSMRIGGRVYLLAASQEHGKCLLFSPPDWESSVVWDTPGGCVSLAPVPGREAFLAVQGFFPVFRSEQAGIVYVEPHHNLGEPWHVTPVLDLPFVHRLEILCCESALFLVAASLCTSKASRDDWSKPGNVYVGSIPESTDGRWCLSPTMGGINKNHGMNLAYFDDKHPTVLVSGTQGLFALRCGESPGTTREPTRYINSEISEVFAYDIDEDGALELATIEPFHGDRLLIYKHLGGRWQPIFETRVEFGHVVWMGRILDEPVILVGNRGGSKELVMLKPTNGNLAEIERHPLDSGIGPTQITVVPGRGSDLILSANCASSEVAVYSITA